MIVMRVFTPDQSAVCIIMVGDAECSAFCDGGGATGAAQIIVLVGFLVVMAADPGQFADAVGGRIILPLANWPGKIMNLKVSCRNSVNK